jgi:hypothetical protein
MKAFMNSLRCSIVVSDQLVQWERHFVECCVTISFHRERGRGMKNIDICLDVDKNLLFFLDVVRRIKKKTLPSHNLHGTMPGLCLNRGQRTWCPPNRAMDTDPVVLYCGFSLTLPWMHWPDL